MKRDWILSNVWLRTRGTVEHNSTASSEAVGTQRMEVRKTQQYFSGWFKPWGLIRGQITPFSNPSKEGCSQNQPSLEEPSQDMAVSSLSFLLSALPYSLNTSLWDGRKGYVSWKKTREAYYDSLLRVKQREEINICSLMWTALILLSLTLEMS